MKNIDILKNASKQVYKKIQDIAGLDIASSVHGIGAGGHVSRQIDVLAEKTVIDYLKKTKFACVVLGEECGKIEVGSSSSINGYVIMDAIDGTANALRGFPTYCCSLAFAEDNSLASIREAAIINLYTGDLYWSSSGKGSYLNNKRIQVERTHNKPYKIIGFGISEMPLSNMYMLESLIRKKFEIRHISTNALEMALLAQGSMDALIDLRNKLRVQDLAAGYHLIKEAGGIVLNEHFDELDSVIDDYSIRLSFVASGDKAFLENEVITEYITPQHKKHVPYNSSKNNR